MNDLGKYNIKRRGLIFVLSSPSGTGKTTISRKLLKEDSNLIISTSHTTRKRRPGESGGHDYHFVDEVSFNKSIANNEFLEWAKVFGNYYGTPRQPIEEAVSQGKDVLFDIDWQGTQQLGQAARGDLVTVFLLPPSLDALEKRLISRAQDSQKIVQERMERAANEMSHWAEYDYVIINEDLEKATSQVRTILQTERLKRAHQIGMSDFVKRLIRKVE